jgi:lipoprotein-anchoring transpeptidase ErfK/SrfK
MTGSNVMSKKAPARKIVVSLANRTLQAWEDDKLWHECDCATGTPKKPTDKGRFHILRKYERYTSKTYNRPMNHACFFSQDGKAIHEAEFVWLTHGIQWFSVSNNMCDEGLVCGSHGCVRLAIDDAKKIFNWVQVGDPVSIE